MATIRNFLYPDANIIPSPLIDTLLKTQAIQEPLCRAGEEGRGESQGLWLQCQRRFVFVFLVRIGRRRGGQEALL